MRDLTEYAEQLARISGLMMDVDEILEVWETMKDQGGHFAIFENSGMGEILHYSGEWPPDGESSWTQLWSSKSGGTYEGRDREAQFGTVWSDVRRILGR